MDYLSEQFVMDYFLDNDSVSTMNRLVVAVASVVKDNNENLTLFNEIINNEYNHTIPPETNKNFKTSNGTNYDYVNNVINEERKYDEDECNDDSEPLEMQKCTIEALINFLKDHVKSDNCIVPLVKKVQVFLCLMTSEATYSEVGMMFNLHKSSVSYFFTEIVTVLAEQRYNFISWPSIEEQHSTRIKVNHQHHFPNCIGFIDACQINVCLKRERAYEPETILLQAVCDESLILTDIHIGCEGVTQKGEVFQKSSLVNELKNFVDFENHILGDTEYILKDNLIIPFNTIEAVTETEIAFNEIHKTTHAYIKKAFNLLKLRFKRLNNLEVSNSKQLKLIITAACVLHNFILLHEGSTVKEEIQINCEDAVTINTDIIKTALEKRHFLCNYINFVHKSFPKT